MDASRRQSFPYLIRTVTRHGSVAWYFWRRPGAKIRVRGEYGTKEFRDNYWKAANGAIITEAIKSKKQYDAIVSKQKVEFAVEKAVRRARVRAKEKGVPCDITFEWAMDRVIERGSKCEMTGLQFFHPSGDGHRVHPFTPSIDRIDPTGGYTKGNCRIVTFAFNAGVNEWGPDVFEIVARGFNNRAKELSR